MYNLIKLKAQKDYSQRFVQFTILDKDVAQTPIFALTSSSSITLVIVSVVASLLSFMVIGLLVLSFVGGWMLAPRSTWGTSSDMGFYLPVEPEMPAPSATNLTPVPDPLAIHPQPIDHATPLGEEASFVLSFVKRQSSGYGSFQVVNTGGVPFVGGSFRVVDLNTKRVLYGSAAGGYSSPGFHNGPNAFGAGKTIQILEPGQVGYVSMKLQADQDITGHVAQAHIQLCPASQGNEKPVCVLETIKFIVPAKAAR